VRQISGRDGGREEIWRRLEWVQGARGGERRGLGRGEDTAMGGSIGRAGIV